MIVRLIHYWEVFRQSYWFIPFVLSISSIVAADMLLSLDEQIALKKMTGFGWLVVGSYDGAQLILSVIASSTFAAATLTFSVTMLTLSFASSHFGPRLLRNFLRDPFNQFIFGSYIATFLYCLIVLRGMVVNSDKTPDISISFAIVLVIFDSGLFIWFIHHITSSIRIEKITDEIGKELVKAIDRIFPDSDSGIETKIDPTKKLSTSYDKIKFQHSGYIQAINYEALKNIAVKNNCVIEILYRPGRFVIAGASVARIYSEKEIVAETIDFILKQFIFGGEPTAEQDVELNIRQLRQIAERALSPGINDSYTAMACIDYLIMGLSCLDKKNLTKSYIESEGKIRVIKKEVSFDLLCHSCLSIFRHTSNISPTVILYLFDMLIQLADATSRLDHKDCIYKASKLIFDSSISDHWSDVDLNMLKDKLERIENNPF